jgi:CRP-like cAMP-binding protein
MAPTLEISDNHDNQLLSVLSSEDRAHLYQEMDEVVLNAGEPLYEQDQPIEFAYFPTTAAVALLVMMRDGRAMEIGAVGNEGMLGIGPVLGRRMTIARAVIQLPGKALRMPIIALERRTTSDTQFKRVLLRYAHAFMNQIARSGACNALHSVAARCARWVLTLRDRAKSAEFPLTHEELADLLGVHRQTITTAFTGFQQAGLLRSHRGVITVLDATGLEAQCCECYGRVKEELNRVVQDT